MKTARLATLLLLVWCTSVKASTCYVTAYVVTPPGHRKMQVIFECFDADIPSNRLGLITKDIKGHQYISEPITAADSTKRILIKFGPKLGGFEIVPPEMTLDRSETLDARNVTWIQAQKDPNDLYVK